MRTTLRWWICSIAFTFVLLLVILWVIPNAPAELYQRLQPLYPNRPGKSAGADVAHNTSTAAKIDSIVALWEHWSGVVEQAEPSASKIEYGYPSNIVGVPWDDTSPRTPADNHIQNQDADIQGFRASHTVMLSALKNQEIEYNIYSGTGVVMVAAASSLGSLLPVEVFPANEEEYEASVCEGVLPKLDARCLIIIDFLSNKFMAKHFRLKALALIFSSFAEMLFLDSDSIPLVKPEIELFGREPYLSTGLVIWPDFWIATESSYFYTIAGLDTFPNNLPKASSEAGQLLVNKRTHLKTVLLAAYYNIYGPDFYYPLLSQGALGHGDKETFMAAAIVLGSPYYRVKKGVSTVGRNNGRELKGSGMVQYNPAQDFERASEENSNIVVRRAFVHANTPKMNAGHLVDEGDLEKVDKNGRLRLWGSEEVQKALFGHDLEKTVWELLVQDGCQLADSIGEWRGRERLCERLEEHFSLVF